MTKSPANIYDLSMRFKRVLIVFFVSSCLLGGSLAPASASSKSFSYKTGFNWIIESNRNDLSSFGIEQVFGINGQPVLRKVKIWCNSVTAYMLRRPPNVNDWIRGCTAATMGINLRQFG